MKVLLCSLCGDMNCLGYQVKRCACGKTGGYYNPDGDTATVWGTDKGGVLLGLNNRALYRAVMGTRVEDQHGFASLWPYPMDNGKITVLTGDSVPSYEPPTAPPLPSPSKALSASAAT